MNHDRSVSKIDLKRKQRTINFWLINVVSLLILEFSLPLSFFLFAHNDFRGYGAEILVVGMALVSVLMNAYNFVKTYKRPVNICLKVVPIAIILLCAFIMYNTIH